MDKIVRGRATAVAEPTLEKEADCALLTDVSWTYIAVRGRAGDTNCSVKVVAIVTVGARKIAAYWS